MADGVSDAGTAGALATSALQQLSSGITNTTTLKLADILAVSAPNEDATAELSLNALNLGVSASVAGVLSVTLNAVVGQGVAELTEFQDDGDASHVVIAATPGIVSVDGSATVTVLGIPIGIGIDLPVETTVAQDLEFDVSHPTADNLPQTMTAAGSTGDSLENALQQEDILIIPVLGALVEPLVETAINTLLAPLLGEIGRRLLDPLLEMLGIRLGGMDVTLHDIQLRQARPVIL